MAVLDSVQMNQLVQEVTQAIQSNSQGVGEIPVVSSLSGINSLPALNGTNVVEVPIELLEKPAKDAAMQVYEAIANADDTANHPTYIGEDNYVYKWDKATQAYNKTSIYVRGEAFSISKVYPSIEAMEADKEHGLKEGAFVLINTGDVENPDNAKVYVADAEGNFTFLVDMSGAIGFTGKTPQIEVGIVSVGANRQDAGATLAENGEDEDGNPKYLLNIKIPSITMADLSEAEIALLQKPASDMIARLEATDNTAKANEENRVEAERERVQAEATRKVSEETRITNESNRIDNEAERESDEALRKAGETARINNENSRQTAESSRKSAENNRVAEENERATAEQARIEAEEERKANESVRQGNEDKRVEEENKREEEEELRSAAEESRLATEVERVEAENERKSNESVRMANENSRAEAELSRAEAETTRSERESVRVTSESERINAETARKDAEKTREANEQERITKEQTRVANESVRVSAEDIRIANEDTRKANESVREKNESQRIASETSRTSDYAALREEIIKATDNANDAAAESRNAPVIREGMWWVFSAEAGDYVNTNTPAVGKAPQIVNGNWWTWNEETNSLEDTGQSVSSDYVLTKSNIESVLTGDIQTHYHDQYVEKEEGKGLSEANFTQAEKEKLDGLKNYDDTSLTERVQGLEDNMPTKVSDLENDKEFVTASELQGKDYATHTELNEGLGGKVEKVEGMGLSETSFTQIEKDYLATLHNYDDTALKNQVKEVADAIPTKVSQVENDSQYITATELTNKKYATEASLNEGIQSLQAEVDTKQAKNVYYTNLTATAWIKEDVYEDYPYRCDLACEGVTENDYAEVVFSMEQHLSGDYAPICETKDGIVSIWSAKDVGIVVPTVIIYRG